ncbi:MAG: GDSL-type esterase/lipase family protein [Acidimicrobiales bacterium]
MRGRVGLIIGLATAVATVSVLVAAVPGVGGAATLRARPPGSARLGNGHGTDYYLSLGDSYSVGYQPGIGATAGYTALVAKRTGLKLENFGCGGATTTSILKAIGCTQSGYGPPAATDAVAYPTMTQEQAAVAFIAAHPGAVRLVTVSIGGNDVTSCVRAGSTSAIVACVERADSTIATNVTSLVTTLNNALSANGDTARIIGLTYPDVILGSWVYPAGATNQTLASLSVVAFDKLINPTLQKAYTSVAAGSFVDVTQAPYRGATAGDDTPPTVTRNLPPYGRIPKAVAEICQLTYYCSQGNIHANTRGYDFIGSLITRSIRANP